MVVSPAEEEQEVANKTEMDVEPANDKASPVSFSTTAPSAGSCASTTALEGRNLIVETTSADNIDNTGDTTTRNSMPSLTQMVNDDRQNVDPDRRRMMTLLVELRSSLELFVSNLVMGSNNLFHQKKPHLVHMINDLQRQHIISSSFASAMHDIRDLGNRAAHRDWDLPSRSEVEHKVQHYQMLKKQFEQERRHCWGRRGYSKATGTTFNRSLF